MSHSNPVCELCDTPKEYVSEPLARTFRGYVCKNDECPYYS